MDMTNVESSNIDSLGFKSNLNLDGELSNIGTLRVKFTHGAIYDYKNVTFEMFKNFLNAKSIGKFFHEFVSNKFTYSKID